MFEKNKGFNPDVIQEFKEKMKIKNQPYLLNEEEENTDEYVNFYFIGKFEGKEVVYDCALYTLRLQHTSEVYETAEHKAAKKFPEYQQIKYEEDENGDMSVLGPLEEEIGLYMAEVMMELEEEETIKVQEHLEIDEHIDFGIGIDAGLNVDVINSETIETFIKDFNEDSIVLDKTLYSFQHKDDEIVD
ncbi:hypothetical protein [Xanthovirga aplysinae]|uniref:hypothetical protein n=1 Tax=Xanthovirga aplysinae TaxID=2529853 RepID=UPI0012BB4EEE|nr:hypothetical protein [Xanthovirga aplysinae]MTI30849.1 hypothetical protein [Xanthovirga aplysinae]